MAAQTKQTVDLVFFDSNAKDMATWMAQLNFGAPVGYTNLEEIVDKMHRLCSSGLREVGRLTIIGHGDKWHQSIGANELRLGGKNNDFGQEAEIIKRMRPFLAKNAVVVLGGCQVGGTDDIVNALSRILPGVKVVAFTAQQRPALCSYLNSQGGKVESVNGQVVNRTAPNSWDNFDNALHRVFDLLPTLPER